MSARRRRVFSEPTGSLDELLARTPEQLGDVGIAEMNLLCATDLRGAKGLNLQGCLAMLRTWARRVERETNCHMYLFSRAPAEYENSEGFFRMMMLVTVLQQDFKVRYNPDRIHGIDFRDSRDLFIHGLLEEPHAGTCASMPVLYVAVGRRLGYPLKLVLTQGHIFARWESPDGRERFNIECASRGMLSFSDEYYKTWPIPITDEQARRQRYLISLGPAEELAVFLDSRGHCLLDNGRIPEARVAYERACRLDPLRPAHRCWLNEVDAKKSASVGQFVRAAPYPYWETTVALLDPSALGNACSADSTTVFSLNSTRYRYYHPGLGRWVERDPVEKKPVNLYEYVADNPTGGVDPMGLELIDMRSNFTSRDPLVFGMQKVSGPDDIMKAKGTSLIETPYKDQIGFSRRDNAVRVWKNATAEELYEEKVHEVVSSLLASEVRGIESEGFPGAGYTAKNWALDPSPDPDLNKDFVSGTHNLASLMGVAAHLSKSTAGARAVATEIVGQAHFAPPGVDRKGNPYPPVPWEKQLKQLYDFICRCSIGKAEGEDYRFHDAIYNTKTGTMYDMGFQMRCSQKKPVVLKFWLDYYADRPRR